MAGVWSERVGREFLLPVLFSLEPPRPTHIHPNHPVSAASMRSDQHMTYCATYGRVLPRGASPPSVVQILSPSGGSTSHQRQPLTSLFPATKAIPGVSQHIASHAHMGRRWHGVCYYFARWWRTSNVPKQELSEHYRNLHWRSQSSAHWPAAPRDASRAWSGPCPSRACDAGGLPLPHPERSSRRACIIKGCYGDTAPASE